ncbi:MAG: hypothetical protein ACAH12_01550 [Methylophilaceae bacterium]
MKRYLTILSGPILMLFLSAILVHVSVLGPEVIVLNTIIQIFALALGGWLLSTRLKFSISAASFSGPLLLFIDIFLFGYIPSILFGQFPPMPEEISPNQLVLGSFQLTALLGILSAYVFLFPVSLAVAAIGSYIGVRGNRRGLDEESAL